MDPFSNSGAYFSLFVGVASIRRVTKDLFLFVIKTADGICRHHELIGGTDDSFACVREAIY